MPQSCLTPALSKGEGDVAYSPQMAKCHLVGSFVNYCAKSTLQFSEVIAATSSMLHCFISAILAAITGM